MQRQEDFKFQVSLGELVRPCLKIKHKRAEKCSSGRKPWVHHPPSPPAAQEIKKYKKVKDQNSQYNFRKKYWRTGIS